MTQAELHLVPDAWNHLPQLVRDFTVSIETEAQYQNALRLFEAVLDQVGEMPDHPLGSLLLRDRITVSQTS